MKAIRFTTYGDPSVLELAEVQKPIPHSGEALIRVAATTFNPVDAAIRAGVLQQQFPLTLPHIPGIDVSGVVTAVGADVDRSLVGSSVVAFLPMAANGAAAEYVTAPANLLATAPVPVPLSDAAALPSSGLTAWQALIDHAGVYAGSRVLVNGAGGGVGGFTIGLAKHLGAHVIATASPRSSDAVRAAGADEIIDYTRIPVIDALTEPVDFVVNLVRTSPAELAALRDRITDRGALVSTTTPAVADASRNVRGENVFVRSDAQQLRNLVSLLDRGVLRLDVSARYPLAELPQVHALGERGQLRGKTVVQIAV
ncbi:NADP-dependent oxidoreductase [Nocardia amamiensis]|uniref:NADP-dependent oxidoreductase n=1 Tax=Nocardia amamiensis TaxID=404578 RepID=A0ABS0CYF1_9NOCA|nr:NADP-dependent oxidoreductase [Nocardia amamiensis]MBF6301391.1 NADP-dependent oxidoreductase [Nocardia amamiensis]